MFLEECKQADWRLPLPEYRERDVNRRALRRGLGAERCGAVGPTDRRGRSVREASTW